MGTSLQKMGPSSPRVTRRSTPAQLTAPGWSLWLLALASNSTSLCFRSMAHTTSSLSGKNVLSTHRFYFMFTIRNLSATPTSYFSSAHLSFRCCSFVTIHLLLPYIHVINAVSLSNYSRLKQSVCKYLCQEIYLVGVCIFAWLSIDGKSCLSSPL